MKTCWLESPDCWGLETPFPRARAAARIPALKALDFTGHLSRADTTLSHQGVTGMSRKTVLVADDYEDARMILRRLLEMEGCRVVEAADGLEAVELAARH